MTTDSNVNELLEAQLALASTVREYITQISNQLRTEKDQATRDKINDQLAEMTPIYIRLTGRGIAIIAASSKEDVENIKAVSKDVQKFIYGIKRIEEMLTVATSIVKFVVVCLGESKNPVSIFKAGKDVYDAINAVITKESQKGSNAAINLKALKSLFTPSLLGGKTPVARAAGAKAQQKPAVAGAKKKTK